MTVVKLSTMKILKLVVLKKLYSDEAAKELINKLIIIPDNMHIISDIFDTGRLNDLEVTEDEVLELINLCTKNQTCSIDSVILNCEEDDFMDIAVAYVILRGIIGAWNTFLLDFKLCDLTLTEHEDNLCTYGWIAEMCNQYRPYL